MWRGRLSFIVVAMTTSITIRRSSDADTAMLRRLAELDSAPPMEGPVLMAELGDRPIAAISLDGRRAIADPFVPTERVLSALLAWAASGSQAG
ncbi:MAG: hypothetical protein QOD71_2888 [Thermoleophilaceae bacterium]|nr:hypothetical protein [Thermoleophilaceae bacterium]